MLISRLIVYYKIKYQRTQYQQRPPAHSSTTIHKRKPRNTKIITIPFFRRLNILTINGRLIPMRRGDAVASAVIKEKSKQRSQQNIFDKSVTPRPPYR